MKPLYQWLLDRGYSEDDAYITLCELEAGIPLPEEVRRDYKIYIKEQCQELKKER